MTLSYTNLQRSHLSSNSIINCDKYLFTMFAERYGISNINKWKFETWNEPDLSHYNTLNYTFNGKLLMKSEKSKINPINSIC